jgi:hypothetical protein
MFRTQDGERAWATHFLTVIIFTVLVFLAAAAVWAAVTLVAVAVLVLGDPAPRVLLLSGLVHWNDARAAQMGHVTSSSVRFSRAALAGTSCLPQRVHSTKGAGTSLDQPVPLAQMAVPEDRVTISLANDCHALLLSDVFIVKSVQGGGVPEAS